MKWVQIVIIFHNITVFTVLLIQLMQSWWAEETSLPSKNIFPTPNVQIQNKACGPFVRHLIKSINRNKHRCLSAPGHLFVLITYSQHPSSLKQEQTSVIKCIICSIIYDSLECLLQDGSLALQLWPSREPEASQVILRVLCFHCFHTQSPMCCCIHNDRRCFVFLCLFVYGNT